MSTPAHVRYAALGVAVVAIVVAAMLVVPVSKTRIYAAAFSIGGESGFQLLIPVPDDARSPVLVLRLENSPRSEGAAAVGVYVGPARTRIVAVPPGSANETRIALVPGETCKVSLASVGGTATGAVVARLEYKAPIGETSLSGALATLYLLAGGLLGYAFGIRQKTPRTTHNTGGGNGEAEERGGLH